MSKGKKIGLGVAATLGALVLYLIAWPVPIDPVAWTPPTAVEWPVNDRLATVKSVELGDLGRGTEDVAVDSEGRVYVGLSNGKLVRLSKDGTEPEVLANTGGHPLGLQFAPDGALWICDSLKGLLRVSPEGKLEVMATECDGVPFGFTNDVDVAKDGTVYFTDASTKFPIEQYKLDLLEHGTSGRLMAYDPKTKAVKQLLGGLSFCNGVALAWDESYLLVAETATYSVLRYWLKGDTAGSNDVLADNLPGFPDGISTGKDVFWLAIASPRDPVLDAVLPKPFLRKVICRLPEFAQPAAKRHSFVLGLDATGKIVHDLQYVAPDSLSPVTSVQEHGGLLYLGTLDLPRYGTYSAPH